MTAKKPKAKAVKLTPTPTTRRVPPNQIDPYEGSKKVARTADFTGVGDYKPVSAGQYEAEFISYEWKTPVNPKSFKGEEYGADAGKPFDYANCKWTIREETDANGDRVAGKVVFTTYSENPASLWALKGDSVSLGEDPEMFVGKIDLDLILGNMVGRSGLLTVVVDSYTKTDGSVRVSNKVQKIEAIEQAPASISARR